MVDLSDSSLVVLSVTSRAASMDEKMVVLIVALTVALMVVWLAVALVVCWAGKWDCERDAH